MSHKALLIVGILLLITVVRCVGIIPQETVYIVERLGKFHSIWEAGLHIRIPLIDSVSNTISLKEQVADFPPQTVITRDNVMLTSDSVVYYKIVDPKLNTYGVEDDLQAIENLTATLLRSVLGEMTLDECLNSRDKINSKMLVSLDEATDPWGIKVTRVEVKNITPPAQMQQAMERQATAEREKRAAILEAEGEKESAVLRAEGNKRSMILNAEADKERVLREAEAEAKSIEMVGTANANAIRMINEAKAGDAYLTLKKLEALSSLGNGKATKIIVPSDLGSTAGVLSSIVESVK